MLVDLLHLLKRRAVVHGVDERKGLSVADVQLPHAGKLLRAGSVQDLHDARPHAVDVGVVSVVILDGRVVGRREDARYYPQRQSALPDASRAQ